MPKTGKKLKVVNVSTEIATESPTVLETEEAPQQEPTQETTQEVLPINDPEPVKIKPKVKAKPKAKAASEKVEEQKEEEPPEEKEPEEEPEPEEELKEEEQAPEEEAPEEGKKSNNLVQCDDCGKWLTSKGLKYSHKCPANKTFPKITQAPITPKVIKKDSKIIKEKKGVDISKKCSPYGADYSNIPEEIIQKEIEKRRVSQRELRIIKKEEIMKKLSMNIA